MSDDAHVDEVVDQVKAAFAEIIRDCFGEKSPPTLSQYVAARLCESWISELRGMRVSVPSSQRGRREAIASDWVAGFGLLEVMLRNNCSRATAYRYHPSRAVPA